MAVRKKTASPAEINFSTVKIIDNANRYDNIYSEISDKLIGFKNGNVQQAIQRTSESDSVRETTTARTDRRRQEYTGGELVTKKPRFLSR